MRRRDEVLVGLFTTVAIIILALASIWLVRGGLNRGYLLHSRFTWGAGIKQGAPVWLVGVTVGTVDKVDLDPRGTLLITYRIQKDKSVPIGTVATIVPNGFFGDQAIAFTPAAPNEVSPRAGRHDPDRHSGGRVAGTALARRHADRLPDHHDGRAAIADGGLGRDRRDAADAVAMNRLARQRSTRSPRCNRARFRQTLRCAAKPDQRGGLGAGRLDGPRVAEDGGRVRDHQRGDCTSASVRFNTLLTKVDSGDGSLSKLLNDPALYNDLRAGDDPGRFAADGPHGESRGST